MSEKPAPFHFSIKLWLELFLSPPSRVYSFPCPRPPSLDRDQHLGGGGEVQDNTWGNPRPPAWPHSPAHTCPTAGAGGRVQGAGSRPGGVPKPACARLNRAGTSGLRYIRYHPEDPEIISPLHNLVTGCRAGGGWLPPHTHRRAQQGGEETCLLVPVLRPSCPAPTFHFSGFLRFLKIML